MNDNILAQRLALANWIEDLIKAGLIHEDTPVKELIKYLR